MKIALVAPGGFDRGGQERVIPVFIWLVERLARRHEVHVITLNQYPEPARFPLLGATVHNIGYRTGRLRALRQTPPILRLLSLEHRRQPFDVIHGLWATHSGLIAALCGRLLRVPTVVTVAGGELIALPEIGYGAQLRGSGRAVVACALRMAGSVTCASETMLRLLRMRRPDALLVPFGVDCALFHPPERPPSGPPWRLLHVASLNRVKDQPTLLRAFARIHAEEPTARLDIVGEDTLGGEIQRLALSLGLEGVVCFHGFETSCAIAARLQQTHLLMQSSRSEAAQMVVLEAAACGVPTVGTAVGHITDLAPSAAVAVPVADPEALARAALNLLRSPDRRAEIACRALAFARKRDADFSTGQMEKVYARQSCIR